VADLLTRAREQGAVAVGDIAVAIDSSDMPAQALDGIVRMLTAEGVEVVDAAHEDAEPRRSCTAASRWPVPSGPSSPCWPVRGCAPNSG